MGRATDAARIQFRMLNRSKGPAVWGPRAQCDRALYPIAVRNVLDGLRDLDLFQEMVTGLILDDGRVVGVQTRGLGRVLVIPLVTFVAVVTGKVGEIAHRTGRIREWVHWCNRNGRMR